MLSLSRSPEQTIALGRGLAEALEEDSLVVSLVGDLGSGKTLFAKGVASGYGIPEDAVASPTFVIANEYPSQRSTRLVHADLYRLSSAGELESAGFLDWISGGRVALIEWGDRVADALPRDHLRVSFRRGEQAEWREIRAEATGPRGAAVLSRWKLPAS